MVIKFFCSLFTSCTLLLQVCACVEAAPTTNASSATKSLTRIDSTSANRPVKDKWALVIGISKFLDPQVPGLRYPSKDAKDFAEFLVNNEHFARDHVRLLTDEGATKENILDALGDTWLPQRVLEDDLVVIFISTHGSPADKAEENFIVAHDTNSGRLFSTGIKIQDLASEITRRTGCDRVVLILDACHSGAAELAAKGLVRQSNFDTDKLVGSGLLIISSSQANEVSWESKNYPNGVFTRRLIEALQSNGQQTKLLDAFTNLREKVEQEVKFDRTSFQRPVMKSSWKGDDLVLAVVPVRPRTYPEAELPIYPSSPQEQSATPAQTTVLSPPVSAPSQVAILPTVTRTNSSLQGLVEHAALPNRVALFSFSPPAQYELSASGGYPAITDRDRYGITNLPNLLFRDLRTNLGALGERLIPPLEMESARQPLAKLITSGPERFKEQAQILHARYLVVPVINSFAFKGKVLTSNDYELTVTSYVISGSTGEVLWQYEHRFHKTPWASDGSTWFVDYLSRKISPEWSKEMAKSILKNIPND
jgi:hypothetical protein